MKTEKIFQIFYTIVLELSHFVGILGMIMGIVKRDNEMFTSGILLVILVMTQKIYNKIDKGGI